MDNKLNFSELLAIAEHCFVDFDSLLIQSDVRTVNRYGVDCVDEVAVRKSELNYDKLSAYIKILNEIYSCRPLPF